MPRKQALVPLSGNSAKFPTSPYFPVLHCFTTPSNSLHDEPRGSVAWPSCTFMLLKMADTYMGFVLLIVVFVAAIFARAIKITMSSSWYKKSFAQSHRIWIDVTKVVFDPVKRMLFDDLDKHLRILNSDVVEIGIGPGANFDYYPHGTSLIAVDPNPHMEELLKANLEKAGDRVHLKKFVAASADDMSCTGQIGVEDNSVAAVVCTKLLCCLTEDQIRKTLQEVKRVLMPVSMLCIFSWRYM